MTRPISTATRDRRTVLVYTSPARGHLYPIMDVALALAVRHRVVVATLAEEGETVRAAGLEHRALDARIEAMPLEDHAHGNPLSAMRATLATWVARAPLEVEDLHRAIAEVAPDLLLIDANAYGAAAAAEASGIPWAQFLPYCLPVPSRDAPAFGPGFPPPAGWLGRLRDTATWAVQNLAAAGPLGPLRALRGSLGLPPGGTHGDLLLRAPLLLYRTAEPFEYPRSDWPPSVRAVGPGLWAPPAAVPDWLRALPRPRVLVSVSTEFQDDGAIVAAALDAFRDTAHGVVVTTAALDPARFRAPDARFHVTRFLPHAAVIPEVDLVVTHGGMGTTQRALAAGVPVVVVPWGRDQLESGRRAVVAGAGVMLPRAALSGPRLAAAAAEALACRDGARRVAQGFAAAGGAIRAVELLEELWGTAGAAVGGSAAPGPHPETTPAP